MWWYAWRCYGAVQLRLLDAPTPAIILWGRWASPNAAQLRVSAKKQGVPPWGPLVEPVDLKAWELGWADRP